VLIELSICPKSDLIEAAAGFDCKTAYLRLNAMIHGVTDIRFPHHNISDDGQIFLNVTELLVFLHGLASRKESKMTLRFESRAYAVHSNDGYDILNSDDHAYLDHITCEDVVILITSVETFVRNSLMHINPAVCDYYLSRHFLTD
jgi:hypothetical protein